MIYFKRAASLFLTCFTLLSIACGQIPRDSSGKIAPELLKQDFLMLKDTLQKIQPGLYRYRSRAEINHIFDSCLATIRGSMSVVDFYALTSYAIAAIEDGHTNCRLPKKVMSDYLNSVKVFPGMLLFIHNKAYIFCCKQNSELAGTELLTIDRHSLNEIIRRLFDHIPSDGSIQSRKNWELSDNFPLLYNFIYGVKDSFEITYRSKAGDIKNAGLQAGLLKDIACAGPFKRPGKYLRLTYEPGKIAVLSVNTFFDGSLQQTGENFHQFLDSSFKDLKDKKVKKLLIDLRGNQGGNDENGELLYAYLARAPFNYYSARESTVKQFHSDEQSILGRQYPKENNFTGKVYFLTDGRSFSATAEFAAVAKSKDRGLFIGGETGGGYYGNTSGDETMLILPNTRISCRIPMIKYTLAVKAAKYRDRGVIPDYPFYPTIGDIIENKDAQLEYAVKLAAAH